MDGVRARWFGAGALAAVMAVAVYEGGVTLASTHGHGAPVRLAPGESATVSADGAVSRGGSAMAASGNAGAATTQSGGTTSAGAPNAPSPVALVEENARLRSMLESHGISPETGVALAGDAGSGRRGIEDDGNTDLTPDEWRTLAARGELRYALPGMSRDPMTVPQRIADGLALTPAQVQGVNDVLRESHDRLIAEVRALYREAVGSDPGNMSWESMMQEVRDKTPNDTVEAVNWELTQERAGLAPSQPPRGDMTPYERMMRLLITYEAQLEEDLAAVVGPEDAHTLCHGGENQLPTHAYGTSGRRPE